MKNNFLGIQTMNFTWNHPNSYEHKIQSVSKFIERLLAS